MDISYIINRLGEENDDYFGALAPPIMQTSNFVFKKVDDLRKAIADEKNSLVYSRGNNPTLSILSKKLAALEGTDECLLFSSGMAAISTAVIANIKKGDHIICVQKPYSWTVHLMQDLLPRFGIEITMIDGQTINEYENALKPNTGMLYLESPNTFTFEMQDLEKAAQFAKRHKLIAVIDNSYSTPLLQQPSKYGIDIICHSASKYIGGHSDTVAGVLCCGNEMAEKIFKNDYLTLGGIISPFNAWLLLRGLRTLPVRMEKIGATTEKLIEFLEKHPRVEKVNYPYSVNHPQFDLAKKQMKHGNGLFSVCFRASVESISEMCESFKYFQMAVSWGGYESLVFPVCTLSPQHNSGNISGKHVRFSIGLEDADVLINDMENAFGKLSD
ncbi:MAG: aminotransferase class I/II-fold pyridoxal phosphate-dependent enzyme [Bacteroidota bacterium]